MILVLFVVSLITFIIFVPPGADRRGAPGRQTTPRTSRPREAFGSTSALRAVRAVRQGPDPWPGLFLNEDVYYSTPTSSR